MSKEYDSYLRDHLANVRKGIEWFYDHGMIDEEQLDQKSLISYIEKHDASKFTDDEYGPYDEYFYGKRGKTAAEISAIDEAFDYAWLNHIHQNPHHWQHWVLFKDDGGTKGLEMPELYVYEMVADWWSFSWKEGKLDEIFDWYEKHKDKMILHPKTRKLVEKILEIIRDELDEQKSF